MYGRRYNKVLTIMLVIIIIAIVALLGYIIIYNVILQNNNVKEPSDYVDSEFLQQIVAEQPDNSTNTISSNTTIETTENGDLNITNSNSSSSTSSKKATYKGFDVIGTIEISKTGIKLPILSKVTKKSLETSVAAIWPQPEAVMNSIGNVVIVGHNYRNGTFFSNNKKLSNGDEIKITDLEGKKITYVIYNIFETTDTDTSFYNRDTDGKREITLSTCTDDSSARLIIEAREK